VGTKDNTLLGLMASLVSFSLPPSPPYFPPPGHEERREARREGGSKEIMKEER
jgi:hypothetical protein